MHTLLNGEMFSLNFSYLFHQQTYSIVEIFGLNLLSLRFSELLFQFSFKLPSDTQFQKSTPLPSCFFKRHVLLS